MAINKSKPQSEISKVITEKKNSVGSPIGNFKVSFQYLDTTQKYGSGFKDWQRDGLLSAAMETLAGYCKRPLLDQLDGDKFTIYGDFPPHGYTLFEHPVHVPQDANWGRIHVTGVAILVGHILSDTFYIVFLDKTHKFQLTKRTRVKLFGKQYEKPYK